MSQLLAGLLGVLVATNQAAATSNLLEHTTGISVSIPDPNDPAERDLKKVMRQDDDAQTEVDGWIQENHKFAEKGAGIPAQEMNERIRKRFLPVREAYEDLVKQYPDRADIRVAFASFLGDLRDEEGEVAQLEKAKELDPKDPAVWNNLANYYGHRGPVKKAFGYYEKAIQLDPKGPIYYYNLATTVYLFRKDVREYYHINEQQVFDKAMALYSNSMRLDPTNFALADDIAKSYYGIKPLRTNDALTAWTNTLQIAQNEGERESVYIHLARIKMLIGRFAEAQAHLDAVTNQALDVLKNRLLRNLHEREAEAAGETNAPTALSTTAADQQTPLAASGVGTTNSP